MRFQVTHKLTTYLLVLVAMATLFTANLLGPLPILLALVAGTLSWFSDPGQRLYAWLDRATVPLRFVAMGFFAWSAYRVWAHLPEPDLTPVLDLVLFLIVYKLFQRAANRDYLQIYVLAFLMVLAGAAFAQSFLFALAFAAYVVITTWTLILLHLRREMEENYLVKHSGNAPSHKVGVARILNSRRVVGSSFLAATGGVALAICAGSAVTFALVPRVGAGFALGGARARRNLVGFSDEVTLGTSGFLSAEDETVALRAVLPRLSRLATDREREAELDRLYWRGTVYETYQKGRWLRAHNEALRTQLQETAGPFFVREPHTRLREAPAPAQTALAGLDRQEIDIVGVAAPVAFALDQPVAFELGPPKFGTLAELRLVPRWSGEVAFQNTISDGHLQPDPTGDLRMFSGAHYVAYSRDPFTNVRASSARPLAEIAPALMQPYLALPEKLAPRVVELARMVTAGSPTAAGKVVAVMTWLDKTHEYSVDLGAHSGTSDPIESFLFDQKSGHCEYFASAAALLLRAAGVPTRYVNGFLGGEWNAVGQYVTVRQNRAHAWVEAYLGETGWMRVDATPPVRPARRMNGLRQLVDSIEFFWGRWVVGYDLGRQLDLARNLERGMGNPAKPNASPSETFTWRSFSLLVAILLLATLVWRIVRRRKRTGPRSAYAPSPSPHAVGRLYRRCLERLAQRGHPRRPSETPREYARRVATAHLEGSDAFHELTELYLAARFGRREIDEAQVTALTRRLTRLGAPRPRAEPHAA